jgi:hypothetical protein
MTDPPTRTPDALPADWADLVAACGHLPPARLVEELRADQARRWRAGQRLPAEAYLAAFPTLASSAEDALVLVWGEVLLRLEAGEAPRPEEYRDRFPRHAETLALQFELQGHLAGAEGSTLLAGSVPAGPAEGPGAAVGRYTLVRKLGEGGMGTVFLAEQRDPVRRAVALKLIKRGLDSAPVLARFEAERRALALMDHPNIARVLDGGATADGRPFFVMGQGPLTERTLGPWARGTRTRSTLAATWARSTRKRGRTRRRCRCSATPWRPPAAPSGTSTTRPARSATTGSRSTPKPSRWWRGGYEGMLRRTADVPRVNNSLTDAGRRVVHLYEAWGKPEQATAWRTKVAAPPKR